MTDEQIIEALDIKDASAEVQQQMVGNTRHVVELRVIGVVTSLMNDQQSDEFQQLVEQGDDQRVWDWLRNDVVGVDVGEVYDAALQDYLEEFKQRLRD